jgi:hypothetical protein
LLIGHAADLDFIVSKGVWVCSKAIIPLIDGFRTRHVEFLNHIPGIVIIALLLLGISIWLFSVAGRL